MSTDCLFETRNKQWSVVSKSNVWLIHPLAQTSSPPVDLTVLWYCLLLIPWAESVKLFLYNMLAVRGQVWTACLPAKEPLFSDGGSVKNLVVCGLFSVHQLDTEKDEVTMCKEPKWNRVLKTIKSVTGSYCLSSFPTWQPIGIQLTHSINLIEHIRIVQVGF